MGRRTVLLATFAFLAPKCVPLYAQQCVRYSFDVPAGVSSIELAGELLSWTGGPAEECERLRRRVEKQLQQRQADAAAAEAEANKGVWETVTKLSDATALREHNAAKERHAGAMQRHSRAREAIIRFPVACRCIETRMQPQAAKQPTEPKSSTAGPKSRSDSRPAASETTKSEPATTVGDSAATKAKSAGKAPPTSGSSVSSRSKNEPPETSVADNERTTPVASPTKPITAERKVGDDALQGIVDPFASRVAGSKRPVTSAKDRAEDALVNPFDKNKPTPPASLRDSLPEDLVTFAQAVVAGKVDPKLALIDRNIETARRALTGSRQRVYIQHAQGTRLALQGMKKFFVVDHYGSLLRDVVDADTPAKRTEKFGRLGAEIVSDIASKGLEYVAPRLLGEKAALVLGSFGAAGGTLLTPSDISPDFSEVIRDTSGRYSLKDKQEAAYRFWQGYARFGHKWRVEQWRELAECSTIVYKFATETTKQRR